MSRATISAVRLYDEIDRLCDNAKPVIDQTKMTVAAFKDYLIQQSFTEQREAAETARQRKTQEVGSDG